MALLTPVVTLLVRSRSKLVVQGVRSCYIIRLVLRRFNCRLQSVLASCKEGSLKGQVHDVASTPRSRGHWINRNVVLARQLNG